jgi:hypothetical protein
MSNDIIAMAREADGLGYVHDAGDEPHKWQFTPTELQTFTALAQAAERNKLAAWMIAQGYATGHGETMEGLLEELRWQVRESEREACAALCDQLSDSSRDLRFGAAVRARGQAS